LLPISGILLSKNGHKVFMVRIIFLIRYVPIASGLFNLYCCKLSGDSWGDRMHAPGHPVSADLTAYFC
jgi:hypothetical protein